MPWVCQYNTLNYLPLIKCKGAINSMLFTCKGELNVVLSANPAETVITPGNDKGSGVRASLVICPAVPPQSL